MFRSQATLNNLGQLTGNDPSIINTLTSLAIMSDFVIFIVEKLPNRNNSRLSNTEVVNVLITKAKGPEGQLHYSKITK